MNGRRWEADEVALVRDSYGQVPTADLAETVGRTIEQVRDMARKLRVTRPIARAQPWTREDLDVLRRDYGKRPARAIAADLGRTVDGVYRAAFLHNLGVNIIPWTKAETKALESRNKEGWSDTEIAAELRRDRHAVSARRKTLGLPCNAYGERVCKKISAGFQRQCERLGLSGPAELRTAAFRRFARESGWPEDLCPREVQILNLLADRGVPMTRMEMATAMGMRTDRIGCNGSPVLLSGKGKGGSYTGKLLRRGMLLKLARAVSGFGQGANRDLYYLGPAALAILEERVC